MPPFGTGVQNRNSSTAIISWTHTFSPGLINEVRGGFARNYNRYYPDLVGSDILSQIGLTGISTKGIHGLPYFTITGLTGTNQSSDGLSLDTDFQVTDNVSWVHGPHAMKFGIDVIRDLIGGYTVPNIYGTYNFTGAYSGAAYADFLLGLPQTTGLSIPDAEPIPARRHVGGVCAGSVEGYSAFDFELRIALGGARTLLR